MNPIGKPENLIAQIRAALYKPVLDKVQAQMPTGVFHASPEGAEYIRFYAYHHMVTNYIVHGVMIGKLDEQKREDLCVMGATKEGLERLAAHVLMTKGVSLDMYGTEDESRVLHDSGKDRVKTKSH